MSDIEQECGAKVQRLEFESATLRAQLADCVDKSIAWDKIVEKNNTIDVLRVQLAEALAALELAKAHIDACDYDTEAVTLAEHIDTVLHKAKPPKELTPLQRRMHSGGV
jgi:hypothetical protein